jgi:hypothetical protein
VHSRPPQTSGLLELEPSMMLPHPMYPTALADADQTSQKAGINELEIEVVPANPPFERVVTNVNGHVLRCQSMGVLFFSAVLRMER